MIDGSNLMDFDCRRFGRTSFQLFPRWHRTLKTGIRVNMAHRSDVQFVLSNESSENSAALQGFKAVKAKAINRSVARGREVSLTERIVTEIECARLVGKVTAGLPQSGAAVLRKAADSGGMFAWYETAVRNCEATISNKRSGGLASLIQAKTVAIRKASEGPLELERSNATGGATILTARLETPKDQGAAFGSCEQAMGALGFKLEIVANH